LATATDARPGIGRNAENSAIAQAHDVCHVVRAQKSVWALETDLSPRTLATPCFDAANGREGVEHVGVVRHEAVDEMAQRGKSWVLAGAEPWSWPI
jgi:hypothetical protein